jgi:voltage-gated potassium channel Kch
VPQIAVEGEVDLEGALVLDSLDLDRIAAAFDEGQPVVVRATTQDDVLAALRRPEVSSVLVSDPALAELDLVDLTYG